MTQHKPINNKHMIHLEDKIFYGGYEGAVEAIRLILYTVATLRGFPQVEILQKWDGAPSVFIGKTPSDRFFISTKSLLNKSGAKVYHSVRELEGAFNGELLIKLQTCFEMFEPLQDKIPNIIQGDLLFTKGDLFDLMGGQYTAFHPNTIIYAAPHHSDMARWLESSELGIVWHTTYHSLDTDGYLDNLAATYGADITPFKNHPKIWTVDPHVGDYRDCTFVKCTEIVEIAKEILEYINPTTLDKIASTPLLADTIEAVINDGVRKGVHLTPKQLVIDLIHRAAAMHKKEINGLVQDAARQRALQRYVVMSNAIRDVMLDLPAIFQLHDALTRAKLFLINTLNKRHPLSTFVETGEGYIPCGPEGYVVIHNDNAVKLINRMEFSRNNFSQDVTKGWS